MGNKNPELKNTHGGRREYQPGRPRKPDDQKKIQLSLYVPAGIVDAVGGKAEAKRIAAEAIISQSKMQQKMETQTQTQFVFGWVASNVNGNFENWSSWKDYGTREDAEKFYKETVGAAEEQGGLDWFCIEIEE